MIDFDFIPYELNVDISDFKNNIQYISSDNGVDLYKAKEGFIKHLLNFQVMMINLYFFEGSLITAYIHLGENPENIIQVGKALEHTIKRPGRALKLDNRNGSYPGVFRLLF